MSKNWKKMFCNAFQQQSVVLSRVQSIFSFTLCSTCSPNLCQFLLRNFKADRGKNTLLGIYACIFSPFWLCMSVIKKKYQKIFLSCVLYKTSATSRLHLMYLSLLKYCFEKESTFTHKLKLFGLILKNVWND